MLQYLKLAQWILIAILTVLLLVSKQATQRQVVKAQELEQRANELAAQVKNAERQFEKLNQFLKDQKERNDATQAKLDEAESDHQVAVDAGTRLRHELARMRDAKPSSGSCPPSQVPSAVIAVTSAGDSRTMLADLLSQCSERREELAQFADKSRIAHASCIGDYRAAERLIEQLVNQPSDK